MSVRVRAVGVAAILFLIGCGGGDNSVPVSGQVTLDGQPVADGVVSFLPPDNQVSPQAIPIRDGVYAGRAIPGANRVSVSAYLPGTKAVDAGPGAGTVGRRVVVPVGYDGSGKETREIAPKGATVIDLNCKSK